MFATSDKQGVVELASGLHGLGWDLVATTGTVTLLRAAAISVVDVSTVSELPTLLGHRLKTLSYKIFGGLLLRRDHPADEEHGRQFALSPFDLLACNFYPFERAAATMDGDEDPVELIDIGGPAMLRAAAKNHAFVIPLSDPDDYALVLAAIRSAGGDPAGVPRTLRRKLAARAFARASRYDAAISAWLSREETSGA